MTNTLVVLGAVKLGGEDAGTGAGTEDAEVEYEQQPVDNGNTAHGHGAHLAYHDVIQQGHKIGDAVLNDNGNGDSQNMPVKRPVADVTFHSVSFRSSGRLAAATDWPTRRVFSSGSMTWMA